MDASALLRSDPHQLVSMLAASNSDSNITKTPEPNRGGGSSSRPSPSPTKQRFGTTGGGSGSGSGSGGSGAGGGVGFSRQSRSREGWKKLNDLVEHSLDAILPAARERVVAKDAATPIAVSGFGSTTPARKPLTATLAGLSGSDPHHTAAAQRAHYLKLHPSVAKYKSNSKSPGAHADARSAFMWNPNADGRGGLVFQKQLKELWANTAAREPPAISTLPGAGGMGSAADALGLGEVGMASVARSTASGANRERELVLHVRHFYDKMCASFQSSLRTPELKSAHPKHTKLMTSAIQSLDARPLLEAYGPELDILSSTMNELVGQVRNHCVERADFFTQLLKRQSELIEHFRHFLSLSIAHLAHSAASADGDDDAANNSLDATSASVAAAAAAAEEAIGGVRPNSKGKGAGAPPTGPELPMSPTRKAQALAASIVASTPQSQQSMTRHNSLPALAVRPTSPAVAVRGSAPNPVLAEHAKQMASALGSIDTADGFAAFLKQVESVQALISSPAPAPTPAPAPNGSGNGSGLSEEKTADSAARPMQLVLPANAATGSAEIPLSAASDNGGAVRWGGIKQIPPSPQAGGAAPSITSPTAGGGGAAPPPPTIVITEPSASPDKAGGDGGDNEDAGSETDAKAGSALEAMLLKQKHALIAKTAQKRHASQNSFANGVWALCKLQRIHLDELERSRAAHSETHAADTDLTTTKTKEQLKDQIAQAKIALFETDLRVGSLKETMRAAFTSLEELLITYYFKHGAVIEENTGLSHLGASTREVILSMEARTDSNQKLYTALAENLRQKLAQETRGKQFAEEKYKKMAKLRDDAIRRSEQLTKEVAELSYAAKQMQQTFKAKLSWKPPTADAGVQCQLLIEKARKPPPSPAAGAGGGGGGGGDPNDPNAPRRSISGAGGDPNDPKRRLIKTGSKLASGANPQLSATGTAVVASTPPPAAGGGLSIAAQVAAATANAIAASGIKLTPTA